MSESRKKLPAGTYTIIVIFIAIISWIAYASATTVGFNFMAYIPIMFFGCFVWLAAYGEVVPFIKNPTYVNDAGDYGKIVGGPVPLYGGKVKYLVSVKNSNIPEKAVLSKNTALQFEAWLSGSRVIEVVDFLERFEWVKPNYRGPPEEVVRHHANLLGQNVPSDVDYLKSELEDIRSILSKNITIYMKAKALSENEAKESLENLGKGLEKETIKLSELTEALNKRLGSEGGKDGYNK